MGFEVFNAHVDTFHHEQEVVLEDQPVAGMVEHPCGILQLLEVLESLFDSVCHSN